MFPWDGLRPGLSGSRPHSEKQTTTQQACAKCGPDGVMDSEPISCRVGFRGPLPVILQIDLGEETWPAQDHTRHKTRTQSHAFWLVSSVVFITLCLALFSTGEMTPEKVQLEESCKHFFQQQNERLKQWFLTSTAHWNHLESR